MELMASAGGSGTLCSFQLVKDVHEMRLVKLHEQGEGDVGVMTESNVNGYCVWIMRGPVARE
eukprot:scaffold137_cov398-Prasinococcus_capsulatus_cf.AAC.43